MKTFFSFNICVSNRNSQTLIRINITRLESLILKLQHFTKNSCEYKMFHFILILIIQKRGLIYSLLQFLQKLSTNKCDDFISSSRYMELSDKWVVRTDWYQTDKPRDLFEFRTLFYDISILYHIIRRSFIMLSILHSTYFTINIFHYFNV